MIGASSTPPALRSVIAVSAGIFLGGIAIFGVEALGHLVVRPPAGLDVTDPIAVRRVIATMPAVHFLPVLLAYVVGPALGAALAARMSPAHPLRHASIVAIVFLVGALMNFRNIPHPAWFVACSIVAFMAAPFLGVRLARR